MLRRACAPLWLALAIAHGDGPALTANAQSQVTTGPAIEVSSDTEAYRIRMEAAASEAFVRYTEWLGPAPFSGLLIRTTEIDSRADDAEVVVAPGLWDPRGLMTIESHAAYGIARQWLRNVPNATMALRDSIAWYLQSRVVERLFDHAYLVQGYRHASVCFFGCHLPWAMPSLRHDRWGDGLGRVELLRNRSQREWPVMQRAWPPGFDRQALRGAVALATLERELGWPALQGALRVVATSTTGGVAATLGQATGRDLTPLFAAAANPEPTDPALGAFSTVSATSCGSSPCYLTQVTVAPQGEVAVPLTLRVAFADGQHVDAQWNGTSNVFEFESTAPAIEARLDPDRIWLLDADHTNGAHVRATPTNVPVGKWIARWIVWLQDAMLAYTFPV